MSLSEAADLSCNWLKATLELSNAGLLRAPGSPGRGLGSHDGRARGRLKHMGLRRIAGRVGSVALQLRRRAGPLCGHNWSRVLCGRCVYLHCTTQSHTTSNAF